MTAEPSSLDLKSGEHAVFTVTATGDGLRYQWFKQNAAIPGATGRSYEIAAVSESDEGSYSVVVSGACEPAAASAAARLTVDGLSGTPEDRANERGARLTVIPQPARGITRLEVELPAGIITGEVVHIGLYDGAGRRAVELRGVITGDGIYSAEFDAEELANGIYVCRVEGSGWGGALGVVMIAN